MKKKQFIISNGMLASKEVISLLTQPISRNVLSILEEEANKNEQTRWTIDRFLMPLGVVRDLLKKDRTDKLASVSAMSAIDSSKQLPARVQRLLGPQIDALLQIAPRLDALAEIKHYVDSSAWGYMYCRDNCYPLLEDTVSILDKLDEIRPTISEDDNQAAYTVFSNAIKTITAPLYAQGGKHRSAKHTEYDVIAKEAFDTITMTWSFTDAGTIKGIIQKAVSLGYKDSEIWALKVLSIRRICTIIYWQLESDDKQDLQDKIDLLKLGWELEDEVQAYEIPEEKKRLSLVLWQVQHMLESAREEILGACKKNESAMEYFNKVQAETRTISEK